MSADPKHEGTSRGDSRFDGTAARLRGYDHHAIRFTRWRDDHPRVGKRINAAHAVERDGVKLRQFMVARETVHNRAGSVSHLWHLYRRLAPNEAGKEWRHLAEFPFPEEVAGFIEDVMVGRRHISFKGIGFTLGKPSEMAAAKESAKQFPRELGAEPKP